MLIAVFSDSHGMTEAMRRAVEERAPQMVLHLGDYVRDARSLGAAFPQRDLRCVCGNCDMGAGAPDALCLEAEGVRIFMTHGHIYGVKHGLDRLTYAAQEQGAALALFGHTHQGEYLERGGVTLINPGSAGTGARSFALLDIRGGAFTCRIEAL